MPWFADVPLRVGVAAGRALLPAGEAISGPVSESEEDDGFQERPSPDWGATAVLLLSRLQLDQMAEILKGSKLGAADRDWITAVQSVSVIEDGDSPDGSEDPGFDLSCVEEGLTLREGLAGNLSVIHGFAVDGSIALTIGPHIPGLTALGLRGSDEREMNDDPAALFERAHFCTEAAARIASALEFAGDGTAFVRRSRYP